MYFYKKKTGFTLAEVLIVIVLLGVVASLVIPTLITKIDEQEFVAKSQKAISIMNQATRMQYVLEGNTYPDIAEEGAYDRQYIYDHFFKKRLNVIGQGTMNLENGDSFPCVYTADGMAFAIANDITQIYVDLNGDKRPNEVTISPNNYSDIIGLSPSKSIVDNYQYQHTELSPSQYSAWGVHYGLF